MPTGICEHKSIAIADRFWPMVENSSGADCWQWLGCTDLDGYGILTIKRSGRKAYRIAWELRYGPIPEGKQILHTCDNPGCVNPEHLFLGNNQINMEDKVSKGRQCRGEKHGQHKLTWEAIFWIRDAAAGTASQRLLAKIFAIGKTTVGHIQSGRTWRAGRTEAQA